MSVGEGVYSPKIRSKSIVRRQLSQYLEGEMTLMILDSRGQLVNPDPGTLLVTVVSETDFTDEFPDGLPLVTNSANWITDGTGLFRFVLTPDKTSTPGLLKAQWNYSYNGVQCLFVDFYEILEFMPNYVALNDHERGVVERITWMFGDLFDTTSSDGPSLVEEFQTHYGYERIAQLMQIAVNKINTTKQPLTEFSVGQVIPTPNFPIAWSGLLQQATYLEVLRHFIRTYSEQPNIAGSSGVAYVDRRDYFSRWQSVLAEEKQGYDQMLVMFKRSYMGLGSGSFILSGGIFGGSGGIYKSGMWAAQARSQRFYPSSMIVGRI